MKSSRFPTVSDVASASAAVFSRFPLPVLSAVAGVAAAITMVETDHKGDAAMWSAARVLLTAFIALPLSLAVALVAESLGWTGRRRLGAAVLALAASLAYFASLPGSFVAVHEALFIRTAVLSLGLHFVVSIAPFLRGGSEGDFWNFNWSMFLRFCLGVLYSVVLFGGLAIAMGSASQLFGFKIKEERYFELWLVITGLFNTCFALHGVPRGFGGAPDSYPRGLRVFAQFALAPLVVVYLAILYPYAAKIAIIREWPNGWVALPVLCLAVGGTLAALFLFPIRDRETWAAWYWRWFFRALLPLSALLFLALRVRVGDYGITESRYFGFVLAIWIAVTCVHLMFPGARSIRWLPASLAAVCLLTTWGPWGAFSWSERSQMKRLRATLSAKGFMQDGVIARNPQTLSAADHRDLSSMVQYLRKRHDSKRLDWLLSPAFVNTQTDRKRSAMQRGWTDSEGLMNWLGVQEEAKMEWFSLDLKDEPVPAAGWQTVRQWRGGRNIPAAQSGALREPFALEVDLNSGRLFAVTKTGKTDIRGINDIIGRASADSVRNDKASWAGVNSLETVEGVEYLFVITHLAGNGRRGDPPQINQLTLLIFAR